MILEKIRQRLAGKQSREEDDSVALQSDGDEPDSARQRRESLTPEMSRAAKFRVAAGRETVEAFVVAFILALLFRAFLAEVFVIPTGSMAPTLMGAHKDLFCDQCECRFEVGASQENIGGSGAKVVVGGVCPNCRHLNPLDLAGNADHKTFNGDRIVVNKYAYSVSEPKRWDVIVFKFPGNPKQNYIKRLVGLPDETITLDHGNVYTENTEDARRSILRKPADKTLSMSHLVYDTDHQSPVLVAAEYPSRWQPWRPSAESPPTDSWTIDRKDQKFVVATSATEDPSWLRYYHRWPNSMQWDTALGGGSLADVDPYRSRAITDFYAYNSAVDVLGYEVYENSLGEQRRSRSLIGGLVRKVGSVFSGRDFNPDYQSGGPITQFRNPNVDPTDADSSHGIREGMHWVGELMVTADVKIAGENISNSANLTFELVKAGIQYQCQIDPTDGTAKLRIVETAEDGSSSPVHWENDSPKAVTPVKFGGSFTIRMTNYDHMMRLWVDDNEIIFDKEAVYDETTWRPHDDDHPQWQANHPLDAAPVGIAAVGCAVTIDHLRIDRDQYYIATRTGTMSGNTEYDTSEVWRWSQGNFRYAIQDLMGAPEMWNGFEFWNARQSQTYVMQTDQFFPLGDNSPGSLDARSWAGSKPKLRLPPDVIQDAWRWHDVHYVPRDLLVGKAVFILWPHPWSSPLPMTPGFDQIEMIR